MKRLGSVIFSFSFLVKIKISPTTTLILAVFAFENIAVGSARGPAASATLDLDF
jgi:hypothetical protein